MQVAVNDVLVGIGLVRVGGGNEGYAVTRLNALHLLGKLQRGGLYIVWRIRLREIVAGLERLYSRGHLRELIAHAPAVFETYGRRYGLNVGFLIKLFCHQYITSLPSSIVMVLSLRPVYS